MPFEFKLPDLGEGIHEAEVLNVKVQEGQSIVEDQPLFEVETDKAVVEIPSPVAGKVIKVSVHNGQIVTVGSVMISIEQAGGSKKEPESISVKESIAETKSQNQTAPQGFINKTNEAAPVIATPATRQLARELKVDLHLVKGSGAGGKISKEDVLAYVENQKQSSQASTQSAIGATKLESSLPDFSKFGQVERIPVRSLRRKTAQLMELSWSKIPHVTHCDEADVTQLEHFRKKHAESVKKYDAKLTMTAFIMKAAAVTLQKYPEFNTSFDERSEEIVFKHYYNIGMAVATDRGLIVPVIQSVDQKSILDLALEINKVAEKARAAKTELRELQGATFTITNIGSIGGTSASPIIHYPEAAILAVMKTKEKPVLRNGKIESGSIMPLCMAFDHRITDGAQAAYFIRAIVRMLEEPASFEKYLGI